MKGYILDFQMKSENSALVKPKKDIVHFLEEVGYKTIDYDFYPQKYKRFLFLAISWQKKLRA
ncbi:hypothetical protein AYR62_03005 [Secundilactobacillus paracollinoides]|uniref:Uncharacterized protein n=1 Tax=Secundilactobacillus paracollinoides TaxID=240427 RepID=A0A1B2IUH2_9LACO|nr:hypothetical protein [Secundilactobacillus paracollinoides]ANZ59902.1 hypothetical protein AYR61_00050 [Secundilactobacillus paracollinoides]ANZ63165.1 hypothetical protein AYR62_03005 [Secundilactobacillus paracollinoides]ANZ65693.1 hypothetical protein AYR63_00055 [Secundilactobacillus paracollinoides]